MGNFLVGCVLPLLLLTAALLNWSLISLVDLIAFLFILFIGPRVGFRFRSHSLLLWPIITFSVVVILLQVIFLTLWVVEGSNWSFEDCWWAELVGLMRFHSMRSLTVIYFLAAHLLAVLVTLVYIYGIRFGLVSRQHSCGGCFPSRFEQLGSHLKVALCMLLPIIQLVAGISHPSWVSLPFFIVSCIGLVDWSLTSNFLGLFRWWRALQLYAGFNIVLLYVYQLPIEYSMVLQSLYEFIGMYRISGKTKWMEICSGVSLVIFYMVLSYVRSDLEEMDCIVSMENVSLSEQLLPSKHSFFIWESRSGVRHTNFLLRGGAFRTFSINFFTYGFPVSLFALCFWSFHFASVCALGLLAYVGFVVYTFPSLFRLHRLNGLLLVFILFWAVGTYIFNLAFVYLNWKVGKDMEVWEIIGLWHYPIPGFFLLAQFCLGILVAVGNLVNNSVFLYMSDEVAQSSNENYAVEVENQTKVLIVATIAWGLRKCSRAIVLTLIFLIAAKPGFIHAVYMIFFLIYLLSHDISKKMRQSLILLCEAHFAVLYVFQLNLLSKSLEQKGSLSMEILLQLGLLDRDSSWDFVEIALLACFCAIHNHGFEMLFSFSAILQHTPSTPVGFSILKAGLNKSVLLSIYASPTSHDRHDISSHERRIVSFLGAIGQRFLSVYRSCGTYIAFLTILITVYLVTPNYVSFGYIFLLLFWIIGRQVAEKTKRRIWFPLKVYSVIVFMFTYSLCIFSSLEQWLSKKIDLYPDLGYSPEASLVENIWESLAILVVMQLYSYERRQSKYDRSDHGSPLEHGIFGFIRRLLIWHSQKILFVALFYASLSPISAFGFLYLLGLVICSTLLKASRLPSKFSLIYTGFLVTTEYLFQMWGKRAGMFPNQKHSDLSILLGFQVFKPGFWGIESGLRGKVIVIAVCALQYNVFRWLEKIPHDLINTGNWEEPCPLFVSAEEDASADVSISGQEPTPSSDLVSPSINQTVVLSKSWPSFESYPKQASYAITSNLGGSESDGISKYSFRYIWGSSKESKCNKKRIHALRKERLEMQKITLKVYLKFWMENMFNLFGLEINMMVLLFASFALLNVISMLYIASLAVCILLNHRIIRKLWPLFVFLFASILILEYFATWKKMMPSSKNVPSQTSVHCHDCWRSSKIHFHYCQKCWLGLTVDDPLTLISLYIVFMMGCFKLHADHLAHFSGSSTYRLMMSQHKIAFVWRDLSFETKIIWTFLDYLRLYFYCHLLDLVLVLILITGTLEYDILHLGYLCFALVFFRMRLKILKKKNGVFKFLRIYNFVLIVLSLTYQSPFVGEYSAGTCNRIDYLYEVIGLYKYEYGFRITSRSALVEIIIFLLVSLQSYIFSTQECDYVSQYLEAEQIGAIVLEQEKKTAWKTAQLQHIRESEEKKRQRNLQVEKMKSEMLNLQDQLRSTDLIANYHDASPGGEGLRRRSTSLGSKVDTAHVKKEVAVHEKPGQDITSNLVFSSELPGHIKTMNPSLVGFERHQVQSPICEISELEWDTVGGPVSDSNKTDKGRTKESRLITAVQLINDGVSQVQSIGNQAVNNLASFLNVSREVSDSNEQSLLDDVIYDEIESQDTCNTCLDHSSSLQSDRIRITVDPASLQIGRIIRHIWSQMRSNNDVVCYCCFIFVFLWNFSLLSMVYLAALFLYALCVDTGPNYIFWVMMLIFTEMYILLQYVYQIIIQHCGLKIHLSFLPELGFPSDKIMSSFVVGSLPLFLVYLFTLIQSFITAKDGEWISYREYNFSRESIDYGKKVNMSLSLHENSQKLRLSVVKFFKTIINDVYTYWKSVTQGSESPPYFVQLSIDVRSYLDDGIQPERIESGINQLLKFVHQETCKAKNPNHCSSASKVRVQSIERSEDDPTVALAVFEVVYASPMMGCERSEYYKPLTPAADVANEILKAQRAGFVEEVGFPYPILSVLGGGKKEVDLYAYIFGADLAVFFLVAIFYQSVIKKNTQFLEVYQLEDQFPKEFVFMLMIIFFLIVLDRVIYLCSFAMGKVMFYLFNLILYTYSVCKYGWHMQPNHNAGLLALRVIYLTKAISLALQAIQIRFGLPHKSSLYQQFLTSEISRVNYLGYRLYRSLPFLYELRCVLDWSCTTTSLTMYDWLKLEDIHASLYLVKCDAILNRAQHKQGEKQTKLTKFCNGVCLFLILMCVIWAPMLMYSSGNPTNIANPINDASIQVDIKTPLGGRLTLYQTSLCERLQWDKLNSGIDLDPQGYLEAYDKSDIQLICCQADASTLWLVPKVVLTRFIESLEWDMRITFTWVLYRDRPKGKEIVRFDRTIEPSDLPKASEVQEVLNGTANSFRIYDVYPRYFRVTGSGDVRPIDQENVVNADLVINRENHEWWSFHDINSSNINLCSGFMGPTAVIVSEETPQGILGETLSKFSIWGLYITFVLAVARFIRLQCSDLRMRIPYENLPSCDRLMAICEDIYAARAEGALGVEEVLYWTLVKIYRSPHMLLEYTKEE